MPEQDPKNIFGRLFKGIKFFVSYIVVIVDPPQLSNVKE